MKQQEMIEIVQQLHDDIGETQVRFMLNQALEEFVDRTRILTDTATATVVADQRYYDFSSDFSIASDDDVLEINQVDYADKPIRRYTGMPSKTDTT